MNYTNNWKNKEARKRILLESFIALLILLSPFIFKTHEYFPTEEGAFVEFWFLKIGDNGFDHVSTHMWFLLGKLVPFYLLLIWFLTCKHWWYHIILIPLTMYAFQIFELYSTDSFTVDSENVLWLLPVCMVVIPLVYFIRIKLYDKHVHGIDLKAMNEELSVLREKEELRKEKENLEKRKERLKNMGGVGIEAFDVEEDTPVGSSEAADELPIPTGNYTLSTELPQEIKEAVVKQEKIQEEKLSEEVEKAKEPTEANTAAETNVVISSSSKTLRETRQERRRRLAREREEAKHLGEAESVQEPSETDSEKSEKDHGLAKKM